MQLCDVICNNFLVVDMHTHLRVWNVKLHCKIFLNIYGKLYVKQLFMFMNYLFHTHFILSQQLG